MMLFNHLTYNRMLRVGIHVATSLMAASVVLLGTLGVSLGRFFTDKAKKLNFNYFGKLIEKNNVICFRKYTGRMNSFRRDSDYLVRSFLTMRIQKDQLFASIKTFCLKALLFHVSQTIICQGRDEVVNILSVCKFLVIVIVYFELELTLRRLRERLRFFTPH